MYSFAAFIAASKNLGLWNCLTWAAGVSGSCWTLAAYYTIANHDISRLTRHFLSVAQERAHPISLHAFDTVVRSSKGVYFLLGPLVRKVRSGIIGLGIMDLYGTLMTTYQLLSREPSARLSRATFQFSKVWTRSGIDKGLEPMPIFTAVRRAPKNSSGVKPHTDSSLSKGRPPTRALKQHQTRVPIVIANLHRQKTRNLSPLRPSTSRDPRGEQIDGSLSKGFFQWFEITPLEVGSPDVNRYIPTWSWGRSFDSGHSVGKSPEQSLALLLGQCTSAPAGPLSGYISALLASIPKGTVMSRLLLMFNNFVRMKKWEGFWGNPIRAGRDPNPFYGHNDRPQLGEKRSLGEHLRREKNIQSSSALPNSTMIKSNLPPTNGHSEKSTPLTTKPNTNNKTHWETEGRIRLMDSGMSNNLPSHILARPSRNVDIILAFDASSDVQTGSAIQRIQSFADDCHLTITDETASFSLPKPRFLGAEAGMEVEAELLHSYSRVFGGVREDGRKMYLVYCPLLPNGENPEFDPSVSTFIWPVRAKRDTAKYVNIGSLFFQLLQSRLDSEADSNIAGYFVS
jgi:phospholipase A2